MPSRTFALTRRPLVLLLPTLLWTRPASATAKAKSPVPVGDELPDVVMRGLNGPDRRISAYRGRRLLINVWASWCGPCRAEAASLERFAWSDAGAKYVVVGISTDDDRRAAERWLKSSNATISHFIDRALELETILGASMLPLTVLVDERGRVVARVTGAQEWDSQALTSYVEREFAAFKRTAPR